MLPLVVIVVVVMVAAAVVAVSWLVGRLCALQKNRFKKMNGASLEREGWWHTRSGAQHFLRLFRPRKAGGWTGRRAVNVLSCLSAIC